MTERDRSTIDAIREALSVPREVAGLLDLRGVVEGVGVKVVCPAHGDRTPSCSLTRGADGTLRVNCFGCDLAGDIFSLVAAVDGLNLSTHFATVLSRAAGLAGVYLDPRGSTQRPPSRPRPAPPPGPAPLPADLFHEMVGPVLWSGRLDDSPIAADVTAYLRARGLLHLAIAEGWAALPPPPLQRVIVEQLVDVHAAEAVALSGLARPGAPTFLHPEARLIIPWRDASGRVTTLQRRRLDGAKPKYVFATGRQPSAPYGIHHLAAAPAGAPVAFVEGAVDALALAALRAREGRPVVALGIPGVSAWSGERAARWALLADGRSAAVALDLDGAGETAAQRMVAELERGGAAGVERWRPAAGKDWGDAWAAGGGAAMAMKEVA